LKTLLFKTNIFLIYFNVQNFLFYIKIIFSDWVTGTTVNFSGMIGRALAVNLKLNFWKSCDHKKSFLLAPSGTTLWSTLYISPYENVVYHSPIEVVYHSPDRVVYHRTAPWWHSSTPGLWSGDPDPALYLLYQWHQQYFSSKHIVNIQQGTGGLCSPNGAQYFLKGCVIKKNIFRSNFRSNWCCHL
jgi:hypothetical protein